jgi:hypothetical protein
MYVCCECYVLSGRGLCDGLITRPEESYRLWRVVVCDQETSKNEEAKARYRAVEHTTTMGCNARKTNNKRYLVSYAKETSIYIFVMIQLVLTTCSPVRSLHGVSNGSYNKIFTNIEDLGKEFC